MTPREQVLTDYIQILIGVIKQVLFKGTTDATRKLMKETIMRYEQDESLR